MKLRSALLLALAAGCTPIPPKDVYISWNTECSGGPQIHRVRVIDTTAPVLDCIKAAPPSAAREFVLLTLIGMPPAACTILYPDAKGRITRAEIYAALTPPVPAALTWIGTFQTPEQVTIHEIEHVFGSRHVLFPFIDKCADSL